MTPVITLYRNQASLPGTWDFKLVSDGTIRVSIVCPQCGKSGALHDHDVDAKGFLKADVVCPASGCQFHDWVQLESWRG